MILRSLTKHVKDQNWFAVGLDFAIVVIGVFIGIQVANWNEALRAQKQESKILQRLESEFVIIIEDIDRHSENIRQNKEYLSQVARAAGTDLDASTALDVAALASKIYIEGPTANSPTYTQLVANGEMNLIRSDRVRDDLARWGIVFSQFKSAEPVIVDEIFAHGTSLHDIALLARSEQFQKQPKKQQYVVSRMLSPEVAASALHMHLGMLQAEINNARMKRQAIAVLDAIATTSATEQETSE